jgi:hypothetical protein
MQKTLTEGIHFALHSPGHRSVGLVGQVFNQALELIDWCLAAYFVARTGKLVRVNILYIHVKFPSRISMINSASHQPTWLFADLICNKSGAVQKTATSLLRSCCTRAVFLLPYPYWPKLIPKHALSRTRKTLDNSAFDHFQSNLESTQHHAAHTRIKFPLPS